MRRQSPKSHVPQPTGGHSALTPHSTATPGQHEQRPPVTHGSTVLGAARRLRDRDRPASSGHPHGGLANAMVGKAFGDSDQYPDFSPLRNHLWLV